MEFSIRRKKQTWRILITGLMAVYIFIFPVSGQSRDTLTHSRSHLEHKQYISAFSTVRRDSFAAFTGNKGSDSMCYTIQVCTVYTPIKDSLLNSNHNIQMIRMGDLYRYIYSRYCSLPAAYKALARIQQIFPHACIREYREGKLGLVID